MNKKIIVLIIACFTISAFPTSNKLVIVIPETTYTVPSGYKFFTDILNENADISVVIITESIIDKSNISRLPDDVIAGLRSSYNARLVIIPDFSQAGDNYRLTLHTAGLENRFYLSSNLSVGLNQDANRVEINKWLSGITKIIGNNVIVEKQLTPTEKINKIVELLTPNNTKNTQPEIKSFDVSNELNTVKKYNKIWRGLFISGIVFSSIGIPTLMAGGVLWSYGSAIMPPYYEGKVNDYSSPEYQLASRFMFSGMFTMIGGGISLGFGVVLNLISIPFICMVKVHNHYIKKMTFFSQPLGTDRFAMGLKFEF
ncbi:MAG: hypothetical protein A2015_05970 [Spirochaetes bacterium GWF1_31_7]|nr:MAG: hypothetical protein A2Y30_07740 [Spirochaetes bacterium GWE1_32_154]OHD50804.1 MAG: hypothetical protein A2Y29_02600 [Spirochaetes bacterium GWE2_31_10]OHD52741.1 MAG: hypothetical protein A2015_05970 [Spirochaetes bacterium GWF1_31_7]OHD78551.1 MAG: hypothetical protein A2355_15925 [Spirochaetes bacterium RIFOXYB1_FULL_32_8]HBD95416.1 hypothetical protein [Spirochaetia bacterium]